MNRDDQLQLERRQDSAKRAATDRIKDLLNEWAGWQADGYGSGWPSQVAFATERVQTSNRSAETFRQMPPDVEKLDAEIGKLAPGFKRILCLEYLDRRPQKTKAALIGIPRQVFSARLLWIYEQLNYAMWG